MKKDKVSWIIICEIILLHYLFSTDNLILWEPSLEVPKNPSDLDLSFTI